MRLAVVASSLMVWLMFEIKDFVNNGGFQNIIAFNLLKIVVIGIMLSLIFVLGLFLEVIPQIYDKAHNIKPKILPPKPPQMALPMPKFNKRPLLDDTYFLSRKNSF